MTVGTASRRRRSVARARRVVSGHERSCAPLRPRTTGGLRQDQLLSGTAGNRSDPRPVDPIPSRHDLDDWLAWNAHDGGQIAIRRARNAERSPVWHIDGVGQERTCDRQPHLELYGLGRRLTDPCHGRVCWKLYRLAGITPPAAIAFSPTWSNRDVRGQTQHRPWSIGATRRDARRCDHRAHYQLAHTAAVNLSCNDRIAIYFRLWLRDIDARRWELLTNIWPGWRL